MPIIKHTVLRILTTPALNLLYRTLMHDRATIFMLHRFRDPERGVEGDDPTGLRQALAYLRRRRFQFLCLEEILRRLAGQGPPLDRAIAFTIDDGFLDQATVACPVFAEFDCPVTTFVATDFLDRKLWFWWNKIEHVFDATRRKELELTVGDHPLKYRWKDVAERQKVQEDFTSRCKLVADEEKHAAIRRLAEEADVHLPERPPQKYLPMSWDQLRECERRGMSFGPHTVTHPILSRVSDAQSRSEIEESWNRLRQEAMHPVPIFCYPNGDSEDFGSREINTLREIGLRGAVTGVPGYAHAERFARQPDERFKIRRFSYNAEVLYLAQYACGLERVKDILRGERQT